MCITLFAWTSLLANIYCGESNLKYLVGEKRSLVTGYRILALVIIVIGSVMPTDFMWQLADFFNALMIFPNVLAILIMSSYVIRVLRDYDNQLKAGQWPVWNWKNNR